MSHKRGYARLTTRYGDIRVYLARGPKYRFAHAGYMFLVGGKWPAHDGDGRSDRRSD